MKEEILCKKSPRINQSLLKGTRDFVCIFYKNAYQA